MSVVSPSIESTTADNSHDEEFKDLHSPTMVLLPAERRRAFAAAASTTAGELITTVLLYPIDLVKSRLQSSMQSDGGVGYAYNGLRDGLVSVFREEGFLGLFTGIRPVMVRSAATDFASVYFAETLISLYRCRCSDFSCSTMMSLLLRVIGCWGSILLTLPLETISARVTTARPPISTAKAIRALWIEGGLVAFWRGLQPGLVLCLNPALMFTAMEKLKAFVLSLRRHHLSPSDDSEEDQQMTVCEASVVAFIAKLFTMLCTYPLVRGKSLMQARDMGRLGLLQVMALVAREEGFRSLYQGIIAQLSKSLWSSSIKYAVKERTEKRFHEFCSSAEEPKQRSKASK
eukprot:TRINITY_DN37580_c0_g1_i1.p1 TRINITY_DN37580_c0_g1~~TRINITY_DN37580_c0_g1_i1.p1  ORF type:complete len:345 (+),score=41.72 TRINITY_DN37580_c0_g1_i1:102-1136(+)